MRRWIRKRTNHNHNKTFHQSIHFRRAWNPTNHTTNKNDNTFHKNRNTKRIQNMKNQRSVGEDELNAEFCRIWTIRNTPKHSNPAEKNSRNGQHPDEIKKGILISVPKPGKKLALKVHLCLIILLSVKRKILVICLIHRCWNRLSSKILLSQAAYQEGRSNHRTCFCSVYTSRKSHNFKYISHLFAFTWHE